MEIISKSVLIIHIGCGAASLLLFWLPVFTRKGGPIHNRIGKAYVVAMWVVVITAFMLSVENLFQKDFIAAAFLGFLSVLTSTPLWYAQAILKNKKGISQSYFRLYKSLHTVVFLMAIVLIIWSAYLKMQGPAILLLIFGIIGLTNFREVFTSYSRLQSGKNWIVTHLGGMLTTGIAAYTAFFAFGGSRLFGHIFTNQWIAIPWVLPSVIGAIGIGYWTRKYTRKSARTSVIVGNGSRP